MILADKIIDLRKKNGLSQEELAAQLGVSRQAVSKWEGAQAVPDIARILEMAKLFSVSIDYLLKDEMETMNPAEPAEAADSDVSLRHVSMEEANAYLDSRRRASKCIALATAACVLSPMIIIFSGGIGSNMLAAIGVVVMLLVVTAAVVGFIYTGMNNKPYEYLDTVAIDTAYGVSGMVGEQRKAHRLGYIRGNIAGVVLCMLAAILVLAGAFLYDESPINDPMLMMLGICAALLMVAVAVYLFIRAGVMEEAFDRLLEEGSYTRDKKRVGRSPLIPAYWCIATAIYLAWSFLTNDWHITWLLWPVAGLLFAAVLYILQAVQCRKN